MILVTTYSLSLGQYQRALHTLGAWWCLADSLLSPPAAVRVAVETARILVG